MFVLACAESSLHAQTCSCIRSLGWCVHSSVLVCVFLFFSLCMCRILSMSACRVLHMQGLFYICIVLGKNPNLIILAHFSPIIHLFSTLTPFFINFALNCMSHITFHLINASKLTFTSFFSPSHEFNLIPFLQVLALYFSKGSTNRVLVWYSLITKET